MKYWFTGILLLFFVSGCISSEVPAGAPCQYEIPGIDNTTIYYLNGTTVKVVDSVANEITVKYMLDDTGESNFKDPVAVNSSGNVSFNVTSEPIFGRSYIRFDFSSEFSGFVAFTQLDGQDFFRPTVKNRSFRVVLPPDHTTGSKFLGIPNPEPDNITIDTLGREVLIWNDPYPFHISVKYYHRSAPTMLAYFALIIIICVSLISGYYYLIIRSLRKKRNMIDKGFKKNKGQKQA
ncbi:MAG: hypothetical protein KKA10_13200 [Euryarchaeota archaeon]|nr:hypothetical protein [Euryarchaeota archaeon]MCG2735958.1 DUF5803 family protein [Candidatus Methanoperedenaceae archaeon]